MKVETKWFFVQALLITILFFACIISAGVILENIRLSNIEGLFSNSDIRMLDAKALGDGFSVLGISCESAIKNNIDFSAKIYDEFKILAQYEEANKIDQSIKTAHKKYDVLRAMFWINSLKIKNECNDSGDVVAYLYQYNGVSKDMKARQDNLAYLLNTIQNDENYNIILVPLAADNGLVSVQYMMDKFNVTQADLPVVLLNNNIKITNIQNVEDITSRLTKVNSIKLN